VSLIGLLEQFKLSTVLQRIETYEKTGLLVIQRDKVWIEFFFRDGRLLCIGPVRTKATLADRLLHDGIISPQAVQETLRVLGTETPSETRIALTLLDRGYVRHEVLRNWAVRKAAEVIQALLTWSTGEIHFEEEIIPSADRLLIALPVSPLFTSVPSASVAVPQAVHRETPSYAKQESPAIAVPALPPSDISEMETVLNPAELTGFLVEKGLLLGTPPTSKEHVPQLESVNDASLSLPTIHTIDQLDTNALIDTVNDVSPLTSQFPNSSTVSIPSPQRYVDTSYMRPDMVLVPVDLSALRAHNPTIQLTPDQWRLLTRVDGQTSLQMACQALSMLPELVCQVAGELIAQNLIQLTLPLSTSVEELSPVSQELLATGMSNGYIASGSGVVAAPPWSASLPNSDAMPQFSAPVRGETQSQWGNGGNGATFVPGRGWIASPQPLQPLQSTGSLGSGIYTTAYVYAGENGS